jgi:hypothetical protein
MDNTDIYKLTLEPKEYKVGLEYHTGGKDLRVLSEDRPREGLYASCVRVLALGLAFYNLPQGLHVGFKSIEFSNGEEPGSVVKAEGFEKKIKLQLPKISYKEIMKRVGEELFADPDNIQNQFNLAVKDLKDEILFYIRGQRQQLAFEFGSDDEDERAVSDKITNFPRANSAAQ